MEARCCANCVFALAVRNAGPEIFICVTHPDTPGEPILVCDEWICPRFEARPAPTLRPEPAETPEPGAALIPLTQNKVAIVDVADFEWLSRYKWHVKRMGEKFYACRSEMGRTILMHRQIMQAPKGMVVDHKKDGSLNNRRRNLRICTQAQNRYNSRPAGNKSGFKGVYPQGDKWYGVVEHKGKQHYAGTHDTPAEAARARDRLAVKLFGEYAWLNFPDEVHIVYLKGTIHLRIRIQATLTVMREE